MPNAAKKKRFEESQIAMSLSPFSRALQLGDIFICEVRVVSRGGNAVNKPKARGWASLVFQKDEEDSN